MTRLLLAFLLATTSITLSAQNYNNEWINYSATYYKFKVGSTGLYRINQPVLAAAGLGSTPAAHFQLWRNGEEVPLYTSVSSGTLGSSDFIEFYGIMNDGVQDKYLYAADSLQMSSYWSLETDTAAYFLTVNSTTTNKRLQNFNNVVTGNSLPAEPYFIHNIDKYFKNRMNPGYGVDFGELVFAAQYEVAEGWTSNRFTGAFADNNPNMYVYASGPSATISTSAAGNTANGRNITLKINGTDFGGGYVAGFEIQRIYNDTIPVSTFAGDAANVQFNADGGNADNIVVAGYRLSYPRQFNFGGASQFYFELPSSAGNKFLDIANFNYGSANPVLFDLTNNLRLTGDLSGGNVRFVLPPSATMRKLVLLSEDPSAYKNITSLTQRNFIDYSLPANQGNYIIISHPLLYDDGSGNNNVENFRAYRASAAGGSYNAKVVDVNQLIDQFGLGIRNNPLAIRNFSSFAIDHFAVVPKYFFMIGHGLDYVEYRLQETNPLTDVLAMIPTMGHPASDNLLTASRTGGSQRIALGRLSAVSGIEVGRYLDKIKQFELAQATAPQTIAGRAWMKNISHITGAISDPYLYNLINPFMLGYEETITDTLFGGKVYSFNQNSGQYNAIGSNKSIDSIFTEGMSLLTYFGHSSPNTLEFNLDNPYNYNNPGKYPLILINGCATGNFFAYDPLRTTLGNGTLSEKYLFANQRGSVGFIANTHLGLPQQIDYFTGQLYRNITNDMYGQTVGDMMKSTMAYMVDNYSYDYVARCHSQEITFHGDPAIRLNPQSKPDYIITDSLVSFSPAEVSVADEKITVNAKILNIGRAVNDSLTVRFQQKLPDNSIITIASVRISGIHYETNLSVDFPINPLADIGQNQVIIAVDPENETLESSELNNTVTKTFTVLADEIRPVYPYNYSIINDPAVVLYGSTANPMAGSREYIMEMDTSRLFNSPVKISRSVTDSGGVIKFIPGISLQDSTVYYWRLAEGPLSPSTRWLGSSFTFISGGTTGFSQSHYYQFSDDEFSGVNLNPATRKFAFDDKTRKLLIRAGVYPYYSYDQNNINLNSDQLEFWGCVFNNIQFYVMDSLTHQPWSNVTVNGSGGYGSWPVCANLGNPVRKFFEFPFTNPTYRKRAMDFFDSIPSNMYVAVRNLIYTGNTTFIDQWKADTAVLGSGNSLWHKFHQMGMPAIDSFTSNRQFAFVFRKSGDTATEVRQFVAPDPTVLLQDTSLLVGKDITGSFTSAWMGPAKSWDRFKWDKLTNEDSTNTKYFELVGKDVSGNETLLRTVYNSKDTSIAFVNAAVYPYLKIRIINNDVLHAKPTQLKYWMLTGNMLPEGGLAPNRKYEFTDSLTDSDTLHLKVAFKNISPVGFDSLKVKLTITDQSGKKYEYDPAGAPGPKLAPLAAGDSIILAYNIPAATYGGTNQLVLDVNPGNDQPEQFHFNNVLYRSFLVVAPICPGANIRYPSGYKGAGYSYQWQVNTGSGFSDLTNDAVYSNVQGDTLKLTAPPENWYGNRYRCVVTKGPDVYNSGEFILKFGIRWTGTVSTAWENPLNWSCGALPNANTDVTIPAGIPFYPAVNTVNAVCRSLNISTGASVTVNTGARIIIND